MGNSVNKMNKLTVLFEKKAFQRKYWIQYALGFTAILFNFLIVYYFWAEKRNEENIQKIKQEILTSNESVMQLEKAKNSLLFSQENINKFLLNGESENLEAYLMGLRNMFDHVDSLSSLHYSDHVNSSLLVIDKNTLSQRVDYLKMQLDTLLKSHEEQMSFLNYSEFELKNFSLDKYIKDIKVETSIDVDELKKKNLFKRLSDALSGNISVQREVLNQVVTIDYPDGKIEGSIEDQLDVLFNRIKVFYLSEFSKFKENVQQSFSNNLEVQTFNSEVFSLSKLTLDELEESITLIGRMLDVELEENYKNNRRLNRSFILIFGILSIIMLIMLMFLTLQNFKNEKLILEANERIEKNLVFKNNVINMLGHEIRSPLAIIFIYGKRIRQMIKDKEVQEVFESLSFTTNSLNMLATQLLEYSKNQQQEQILKLVPVDLNSELTKILEVMGTLCENSGNQLVVENNIDKALDINIDLSKLHQLFYNLVGNASKFTEAGQISIRIDQENMGEKIRLNVQVKDSGLGMTPDQVDMLFSDDTTNQEKFNSHTFSYGIGLKLCKKLVQLFDGDLTVASEFQKGTEVNFYIDLTKV